MTTIILILAMLQYRLEPMGIYDLIAMQQNWLYVNSLNSSHQDTVTGRPLSRSVTGRNRDGYVIRDLNGDGRVDLIDLAILSERWSPQ